jgi:hypothetical protein
MYSTRHQKDVKANVNITHQGKLLATHRMTRKEIDKFVAAMLKKGYEMEITYNGKC